jgi:cytochrome b pre-mRNA-processing protein 3
MILANFRRKRQAENIDRLYGAIVRQARQPAFYTDYAVPDTVEGRLEMIVLHTVLLLHRLNSGTSELQALGQAVFDRFCVDMDDNLREMGVGDLSVPKQMQHIAGLFYGRAKAYDAALAAAAAPDSLAQALRRNIYTEEAAGKAQAPQLAGYVRAAVARLRACETTALKDGRLEFPPLPAARAAALAH